MKLLFFLIVMVTSSVLHPFSYDAAIYVAQKGDIKSADEQLRSIVVHSPDDADVLYDAGVLAHQLNNANQAAAYFARSANCKHDDKELCFRAHFNAGNAYVDTKDLKAALEQYNAALIIDPDNEYARHNRDRVKQMLQEQEKQQDQQKNNEDQDQKDDKDQKQDDQQNKDGQQDEQKQSGNGNDQQQKNDEQQGQDNNSEDGSDQKSDQKSKGEQGKSSKKDGNSEQGKQQGDADKHHQNSDKNKDRNGDQQLNEKSEGAQGKQEQQQGKEHEKTPEKQNINQSKDSIPSQDKEEQPSSAEASDFAKATADTSAGTEFDEKEMADKCAEKINDPWLLNILNEQEAHDKEVNKKLMEARIRQHGGKNGQNCW